MIVATLTTSNTTAEIDENNRHHKVAVTLSGTWAAATVVLQCQPYSGASWVNIIDASWTANATAVLDVSEFWRLRFSLSGGDGTTSVEATAQKVNV